MKKYIVLQECYRGMSLYVIEGPFGDKQWNGYVRVPFMHPWFEKQYDDCEPCSVHGGLTYSRDRLPWDETEGCGRRWFIGFDTLHCDDWMPGIFGKAIGNRHRRRWTTEEVAAECRLVIDQMHEYTSTHARPARFWTRVRGVFRG